MPRPHHVVVLVLDGALPLDVGIPAEVFHPETGFGYEVSLCGVTAGTVPSHGGFGYTVPRGLEALVDADTIVVPGYAPAGRPIPVEVREALQSLENEGVVRRVHGSGTFVNQVQTRVTGALDVVSPGADGIEMVTGTPKFAWEDDSSEDAYNVKLFDALGNLVWEKEGNFDPGGSADATVDYDGPALMPGMIYQFRAGSIKAKVPISSTEDLKGVFVYGM